MQAILADQQQLLQSIPGLGSVWAATVLARVLAISSSQIPHGAKKLVAAAGLDVRLSGSGERNGVGKISKRGSRYLRTATMEAAQVAILGPGRRVSGDRLSSCRRHQRRSLL
jgi:transposase